MKKNIHPKSRMVKVITMKGETIELEMCLPQSTITKSEAEGGSSKDEFHLAQDPSTHQAWTKNNKNATITGKAAEFEKKFQGISDI